jgi:hypothetical protein
VLLFVLQKLFRIFFSSPVNPCVCLQIVIKKKTGNTLFDVCSSCRAPVLSAMVLSLRTSSYANPIPLITQLSLLQTSKRKNTDCCHNLKTDITYRPLNNNDQVVVSEFFRLEKPMFLPLKRLNP